MELDRAATGLLSLVLRIVAPGATRGNRRWMYAFKDSLSKPMNTPANRSVDEL